MCEQASILARANWAYFIAILQWMKELLGIPESLQVHPRVNYYNLVVSFSMLLH